MARDRARKLGFAVVLVAAGVLFAGGLAFAASQTIVGQADNTFNAATYTTDQGEVVQFNVTGSSHNVTANQSGPDGKALFRTPTISGGTTGVQGTQYLSAGSYTFFCSVHPSTMQATLVVGANGTPQPRPSATLSVRTKKISQANKKGILVGITTSSKIDGVSLTAKLGNATIGTVTNLALFSGQQFATVKLSKAGKSKLAKKSKAKITITGDIPFGSPASGKAKLT